MTSRIFLRFLAFGFIAVALAGCRSKDAEVMLANVAAEEILSLGKPADLGTITGLRLRVDGQIEGGAQLTVMLDGRPHHVETLTGTVNVDWSGNWSQDRVRLHYLPGPGVSGSLRVRYRFLD